MLRSPARLLGCLLMAVLPGTATAQSYALADTTLPEVRLGGMVQTLSRLQHTPSSSSPNGFLIRRMRVKLSGRATETVDYAIQFEFVGSGALLDARVGWRFADDAVLHAGRYKVPFSAEQIQSSSRLDFTRRSRVVRSLAPARQIGFELEGSGLGPLAARLGVFNGSGATQNDNDLLFYIGRAELDLSTDDVEFVLAGNAATGRNDDLRIRNLYSSFSGRRTLAGADFRLARGPARLSGEYIYARLTPDPPPPEEFTRPIDYDDDFEGASGFHLTGAYAVVPDEAFVHLRWDHFDAGAHPVFFDAGQPVFTERSATDLIILGGVWHPSEPIRLLVSYYHPLDELAPGARAIEGMVQLSF